MSFDRFGLVVCVFLLPCKHVGMHGGARVLGRIARAGASEDMHKGVGVEFFVFTLSILIALFVDGLRKNGLNPLGSF